MGLRAGRLVMLEPGWAGTERAGWHARLAGRPGAYNVGPQSVRRRCTA